MKYILEREEFLFEKELDPNVEKQFKHMQTIVSNIINDYTFGKRGEKFLSFFTDNYGDKIIEDIEKSGMELDANETTYTYKDYLKIVYSPLNRSVYIVRSKPKESYANFAKAYYIGTPGNLKYLEDFKFKEDKYGFEGWSAKTAQINSSITSNAINYNRTLYSDLDERYLGQVYASNMISKGIFVYIGNFFLRLRCLESGTIQCSVTNNIKSEVGKNYDELDPIINTNAKKTVGNWQLLGNIHNMSSVFEIIDNILKQLEKKIIHIDKDKNLDNKDLIKKLSDNLRFLYVKSNEKNLKKGYRAPGKKGQKLEILLNKLLKKEGKLSKVNQAQSGVFGTEIHYETKKDDIGNRFEIYYDSKTNEFFGAPFVKDTRQLVNDIFYIGTTTKIYDEKNLIKLISKKRENYSIRSSILLKKSTELTKLLYNNLLESKYNNTFMEYKDDKLFFHIHANIFLLLSVNEGGNIISNVYVASKNLTRDLEKTKKTIIHTSSLGSIYNLKRLFFELDLILSKYLPSLGIKPNASQYNKD